jgi:hypothetical protein
VEVGLLWYDDSQTDFAKKVLEAAERYEEKFGARPNRCYVNPELLPNHFWVGVASNGNGKGN